MKPYTVQRLNQAFFDAAASGQNLYLTLHCGAPGDSPIRIIAARTFGGILRVKALSSGKWLDLSPDDTVEAR